MDEALKTIIVAMGIIIGAGALTYLIIKFPGTKTWIREKAIKSYNYLDSIKKDIPEAGLPAWQAAYDGLDAVIDAFGDDEVTPAELRHIAMHGFELVLAVKRLLK